MVIAPPCRTRNTAHCPPVPTPGLPANMDKAAAKKQKELDKAKAKAEKEAKKARVKAEKEVCTRPPQAPQASPPHLPSPRHNPRGAGSFLSKECDLEHDFKPQNPGGISSLPPP